MTHILSEKPWKKIKTIVSGCLALNMVWALSIPPVAVSAPMPGAGSLPSVGTMITPTAGFTPALIRGLSLHSENPLQMDFIIEPGAETQDIASLRLESSKLIKYFLAALTVPEKELWVNLSPEEKDRIIPESLGLTEMGRDMLAQDYLLKQLTASLMYPEDDPGKKFWARVYQKTKEQYGTTDIPMDTFNKIWIVPDRAVVYEHEGMVLILDSHLKVMTEEEYLGGHNEGRGTKDAGRSHGVRPSTTSECRGTACRARELTTAIIREILIPEIEKEVNEGKTFAPLRQIYHSMILAAWYKQSLKESLLGQVYVDKSRTRGVDVEDKTEKEKIYQQYLEAFRKGVFNYIKEDYDPAVAQIVPRKYFSGGEEMMTTPRLRRIKGPANALNPADNALLTDVTKNSKNALRFTTNLLEIGPNTDQAALAEVQKRGELNPTDFTAMTSVAPVKAIRFVSDELAKDHGDSDKAMLGEESVGVPQRAPYDPTLVTLLSSDHTNAETFESLRDYLDWRFAEAQKAGRTLRVMDENALPLSLEKLLQQLERNWQMSREQILPILEILLLSDEAEVLEVWKEIFTTIKEQVSDASKDLTMAIAANDKDAIKKLVSPDSFNFFQSQWFADNGIVPLTEELQIDTMRLNYKAAWLDSGLEQYLDTDNGGGPFILTEYQTKVFLSALDFTKANFIRELRIIKFFDDLSQTGDEEDIVIVGAGHAMAKHEGVGRPWEVAFQYGHSGLGKEWKEFRGISLAKGFYESLFGKLCAALSEFWDENYRNMQNLEPGSSEITALIDDVPEVTSLWLHYLDEIQMGELFSRAVRDQGLDTTRISSLPEVYEALMSGVGRNDLHSILWKILRKEPHAWLELVKKSSHELTQEDKEFFFQILDHDQAMTAGVEPADTTVGGINLDPALLDLQIKRDGKGVPLPLLQQPVDMQIEGFLPVIINVTPVNLPLLLGLGKEEKTDESWRLEPRDSSRRRWELSASLFVSLKQVIQNRIR